MITPIPKWDLFRDLNYIGRLTEALKSEAKDLVGTLLHATNDSDSVVDKLENHLRNLHRVSIEFVNELESLSCSKSGK